jgi:hypothetical protein
MIYNGQNDLIVETPGTFKWAERIHYVDAEKFKYLLCKLDKLYSLFGKSETELQDMKNQQVN